MATDTSKILVGAGVVSLGDYVAAGSGGTLIDVGHCKEPVVMTAAYTDFDVVSERAFGILRKVPQDMAITIRVPQLEVTPERMRVALRQPSGNLSGVSPNETLLVGDPASTDAELYKQIEIVGPGLGSTLVRTVTAWKCVVMELAEIAFAKGDSMVFNVTFGVLYDDSVSTADKFFKSIDS